MHGFWGEVTKISEIFKAIFHFIIYQIYWILFEMNIMLLEGKTDFSIYTCQYL